MKPVPTLRQIALIASLNALIAGLLLVVGIGQAYGENLLIAECFGFSIYVASFFAYRWEPGRRRPLLAQLLAVPVGALAGVGLSVWLLGAHDRAWLSEMAWTSLFLGLFFGAVFSTVFELRARTVRLEGELKERQLREALAGQARLDAQLRMLQAQIEPHFLFNTLAHLSALIRNDPACAERLLADLIAWLRATLQRTRATGSTLGDEIELLRHYLDIFALRLGPRLRVAFDIPQALLGRPFPLLLLQPLVENALTHGIEPQVGGGEVCIRASEENGRLRVTVSDTGAGLRAGSQGTGFGLENVRSRLHALFGDRAGLDVRENPGGGVQATLEIPA